MASTEPIERVRSAEERIKELSEHSRGVLFTLITLCAYVLLATYQDSLANAERLQLEAEARLSAAGLEDGKQRLEGARRAEATLAQRASYKAQEREAMSRDLRSSEVELSSLLALTEDVVDLRLDKVKQQIEAAEQLSAASSALSAELGDARQSVDSAAEREAEAHQIWLRLDPKTPEAHERYVSYQAQQRSLQEASRSLAKLRERSDQLEVQQRSVEEAAKVASSDRIALMYAKKVRELSRLQSDQQDHQRVVERLEEDVAVAQKRSEAASAAAQRAAQPKNVKLPVIDAEIDAGKFLVAAPLLILFVSLYLSAGLRALRQHLSLFAPEERALRLFSSLFTWGAMSSPIRYCVAGVCNLLAPTTLLLLWMRATGVAAAACGAAFILSILPVLTQYRMRVFAPIRALLG
jgi:hypothetical protein